MADSAIGPARNLFHINIFWVKSAKSTAGSVDAKGSKRLSVPVCTHLHVSVYFTLHGPDLKVILVKTEWLSSALLLQPEMGKQWNDRSQSLNFQLTKPSKTSGSLP